MDVFLHSRSRMGCTLSREESLGDDGDIEKGALHVPVVATSILVGTAAATPRHHKLQSTTQPTDSVEVTEQYVAVDDEQPSQHNTENHTSKKRLVVDTAGNKKGHQMWKEKTHHLRNLFAMPLEFGDSYVPPVHPKTDEEKAFIEKALKDGIFFEGISRRATMALIRAFEKEQVKAGTTIIKEGDEGDYFYIILSGAVEFSIHGETVGSAATAGASFGELALLYTSRRAATVLVTDDTVFFRVDQKAFRYILQAQTKEGEGRKNDLLKGVSFLKRLSDDDMAKLAANMTPMQFKKGEVLRKKGEDVEFFIIIDEGEVSVEDIEIVDKKVDNYVLSHGQYLGDHCIVAGNRLQANLVARTDGLAFRIDRDTFKTTIGNLDRLVLRAMDRRIISSLNIIKDTKLSDATIGSLTMFVKQETYKAGEYILEEGKTTEAALYLIHHGKVELTSKGASQVTLESLCHFGEEMMLVDQIAGSNGLSDPTTAVSPYAAHVIEECQIGILSLEDCRKVFDTVEMGKGGDTVIDSLFQRQVRLAELKKHTILGAGTFGQVWLVSRKTTEGEERVYALKIQSKYELVKSGQAKAVVHEKNVVAQLRHPFINGLVGCFQDETFVYMLMNLVQGGELYNVIHNTKRRANMPEADAKFYAAGIHEALGYMHRRGFLYRDLKPENVLLRAEGYPVLIDFGFAKYVSDKTFTFCGTPLYLAPEVILNKGYDCGADNWSLGVLTYEMFTGGTPFFEKGMDQMELFRCIAKGRFDMAEGISDEAEDFLKNMLQRDPTKRLGSLSGGIFDIYNHPWFKSIDFQKLFRMEIKPPFVPMIKNPLDASNFDSWDHLQDKSKITFARISPKYEAIFENF